MIARPSKTPAEAIRVVQFITRSQDAFRKEITSLGQQVPAEEIPWLIVFDVEQSRSENVLAWYRELTESGRSVVLLCVMGSEVPPDFRRPFCHWCDKLSHGITQDEAVELGRHLNRFLKSLKRDRSEHDWREFWEKNAPDIGSMVSFWVALSFWLRGLLDLNESLSERLHQQVRLAVGLLPVGNASVAAPAKVSPSVLLAILEVASISLERDLVPESCLESVNNRSSIGDKLVAAATEIPGAGLAHSGVNPRREWSINHELLARLLISCVYNDREILKYLEIQDTQDQTEFILRLLGRLAMRPAISFDININRDFAKQFAVSYLKIDNHKREFVQNWQQVILILNSMPESIREGSRTYMHHAAITRRRICTMQEEFDLPLNVRQLLLSEAIGLIEKAITLGTTPYETERDLNLYNSLSRLYQDLRDVEKGLNATPVRLKELTEKSSNATQQAARLDAGNDRVLETQARQNIASAEQYPEQGAEFAAQALYYVNQAMELDREGKRSKRLAELGDRALALLRDPRAAVQLGRLISVNNPYGRIAMAWRALAGDSSSFPNDLTVVPNTTAQLYYFRMSSSEEGIR